MDGEKRGGKKKAEVIGGRSQRRARSKRKLKGSPKDLVDHKLMKVLANPERARVLAILALRVASPKEISEETGEGLGSVSYHVKVLREYELIKMEHKVPRRGAVEHFYRAVCPTLLPPNTWDKLSPAMKKGASARILQEFFDDAAGSMKAGIFDDPASDLSWTPLILDGPGVEEIGQLTDDFLEKVIDAQTEASKRLASQRNGNARTERVAATVFLASFPSTRSLKGGKKASTIKRR